jgi:uncharacterized membrane protein
MSHYDRKPTLISLYAEFLPVFVTASTGIGFITGLFSCSECKSNEFFTQMIGYTSIGIITGLTYPISCPLIGGYVLYKNYK